MYILLECIQDTRDVCVELGDSEPKCIQIERASIEAYVDKGKYIDIEIRLFVP